MVIEAFLPEYVHHHRYGNPHSHEDHCCDDCFGLAVSHHHEDYHYVYVGGYKGRYDESTRGNFHYVGPGRGHYERERMAPDHTGRYICMFGFVVILVVVVLVIVHFSMEQEPFDCAADLDNWYNGWSQMKKEYCCLNEGVGCGVDAMAPTPLTPGGHAPEPQPAEPHWLVKFMPDLPLGAKFIMTVVLAVLVGCCAGSFLLYVFVRYFLRPPASKTEAQLVTEISQLVKRSAGRTGEIQVSMTWDTKDDLDLHLVLPSGREISAENKTEDGGMLDIDANPMDPSSQMRGDAIVKPVENIFWPPYSPDRPNEPPVGHYEIYVKVFQKHSHKVTANVTIVVLVSGRREVFHVRILPGQQDAVVTSFYYPGPNSQQHGNRGLANNRRGDDHPRDNEYHSPYNSHNYGNDGRGRGFNG